MINCPNCNTKLKGMLTEVKMLDNHQMNFIKDFLNYGGKDLCGNCGKDYLERARQKYISENSNMDKFLDDLKTAFPIVTIANPHNWNYETLGIVTAQSTMDYSSDTTKLQNMFNANQDLVDLDSSVNNGEKICFEILRQKAFLLGANAILGVDIDYSQFGNKEERMLIYMAGTAVNLTNLSELSNDFAEKKKELENNQEKLNKLKEHSKVAHLK